MGGIFALTHCNTTSLVCYCWQNGYQLRLETVFAAIVLIFNCVDVANPQNANSVHDVDNSVITITSVTIQINAFLQSGKIINVTNEA